MSDTLNRLNGDLSQLVKKVRRSLVQISDGDRSIGAGTIWQADGLIITNAHVVHRRVRDLKVGLPDGRTLPARVLAKDKQHDLAALSVEASNLPTIELGDSSGLQPGEMVIAAGHPWGVTGAITAGAVIDVGDPIEMRFAHGELLQVGLHLRPGHSGGPMVDVQGRLVGVNTMINGPDVGLAIPLHAIKRFLHQTLGSKNKATHPGTDAEYI